MSETAAEFRAMAKEQMVKLGKRVEIVLKRMASHPDAINHMIYPKWDEVLSFNSTAVLITCLRVLLMAVADVVERCDRRGVRSTTHSEVQCERRGASFV